MSEEKLFKEFPPVSTEEWEQVIKKDLNGADYKQKLRWETGEGVEVLPFYRKEDESPAYQSLLPNDHKWSIRQTIYDSDVEEANRSAKKAIKGGADALEFRMQMQSIAGNIGPDMTGTAIQSQQDFSLLLQDISLVDTELHFNTGMLSPVFAAMLANECEKRKIDPSKINGSFLYDPFLFILKHGRWPDREEAISDSLIHIIKFCDHTLPKVRPVGVDASIFRNAGGALAQELGYGLASGSEYLAMMDDADIGLEKVASALHFNFSVGSDYFLEIAKLRAARKLWPQVLKAYGIDEAVMSISSKSLSWNKTKREPYTNMLRGTTEVMTAALGGSDSITVAPFDSSFNKPDEFSQRIARNTQLILKNEAYFDKVSDPAAGSWYIETLTDKIAEAAWKVFRKIEQQGGLLKSIKEGIIQTAIAEARQEKDAAIAKQERVFVGANKYTADENIEEIDQSKSENTVSMRQTENGANIDPKKLILSIKKALNDGAAIGDIAPALFELSSVQIEPLQEYRAEESIK